jgi:Spy/CpxP family protein refolding chaperone
MKKLFVISIMLLVTVSFVSAQQGQGQRQQRTVEERVKAQTDRMVELLKLNADQKKKIEAIELDLNKKMDEKRQNAQGDREAFRAIFQEFDKMRDDKYKEVLTADQFKKYLDNKAQRPQGGQGGQGGQRQRTN